MYWTAIVILASSSGGAHAHGTLTVPASRNGGRRDQPNAYGPSKWFSHPMEKRGPTTTGADYLITEDRWHGGEAPWQAPGTAPVGSPCGNLDVNIRSQSGGDGLDGSNPPGKDGRELPETKKEEWKAGTSVEVAWAINAQHGGGYVYRLCPASKLDEGEDCFARMPLEFDGDDSWVENNGRTHTVKATRAYLGGTQWSKNPVPNCYNGQGCPFPAPSGISCRGSCKVGNILDKVKIPAFLAPGHYVLSWRWDCQETPQVFMNCADVMITAADSPDDSGWGQLDGVAEDEGDAVGDAPLTSLADCQKACDGQSGCESITYCRHNGQSGGCYLKGRKYTGTETAIRKSFCATVYKIQKAGDQVATGVFPGTEQIDWSNQVLLLASQRTGGSVFATLMLTVILAFFH